MIETTFIQDIVKKIAQFYNPDKIILFGSYAKGNITEDSDLDFILVKDVSLPKHKRGIEVRKLFYGLPVPIDFKIYTIANQLIFADRMNANSVYDLNVSGFAKGIYFVKLVNSGNTTVQKFIVK